VPDDERVENLSAFDEVTVLWQCVCLTVVYWSTVCVCRVDSQLTVQLTDNALSRDLFPRDYDCLGDNDNRPVKWLAIEALVDRRFSPASDTVIHIYGHIYLFAVVLGTGGLSVRLNVDLGSVHTVLEYLVMITVYTCVQVGPHISRPLLYTVLQVMWLMPLTASHAMQQCKVCVFCEEINS